MDKFDDKNSTLEDLKEIVKDFCSKRDWDQYHTPKELAIGISTEAGELLDHFRFKSEEQMKEMFSNEEKKEQIQDELADITFFMMRFAQMNNINISKSLKIKIEKNAKKYPVEKVKGLNYKYNEY